MRRLPFSESERHQLECSALQAQKAMLSGEWMSAASMQGAASPLQSCQVQVTS